MNWNEKWKIARFLGSFSIWHFHQCIKMNFKTFSAPKIEAQWKWNGMASELACHKIANLWEEREGVEGGIGEIPRTEFYEMTNAYDVITWQLERAKWWFREYLYIHTHTQTRNPWYKSIFWSLMYNREPLQIANRQQHAMQKKNK